MDVEEIALLYQEWQIAKLTGWTLEYIRSLGLLSSEAFLQFEDAESAILKAKARK